MKREADNNRVKRAIEHLTAAQTNLDSIKAVDRSVNENNRLNLINDYLDSIKKLMGQLVTAVLLTFGVAVHGQTVDQVRQELHRQGVPHADIVLAQARLETGNFTSQQCRTKHNLFGIKHRGRYASYRTWQDSVADYKARISSRYNGGDYFAFLRRIGYAKDPQYLQKVRRCMK